jgi:hypothetical protein
MFHHDTAVILAFLERAGQTERIKAPAQRHWRTVRQRQPPDGDGVRPVENARAATSDPFTSLALGPHTCARTY